MGNCESIHGNILVHCRGGVGRAGLVACCILINTCEFKSHKDVIEFVRKRRDKRCVESRKQEEFVKKYFELRMNGLWFIILIIFNLLRDQYG